MSYSESSTSSRSEDVCLWVVTIWAALLLGGFVFNAGVLAERTYPEYFLPCVHVVGDTDE